MEERHEKALKQLVVTIESDIKTKSELIKTTKLELIKLKKDYKKISGLVKHEISNGRSSEIV
jgi:hypothetical protein